MKHTPNSSDHDFDKIVKEMLPFFMYAAMPILLTILIAYIFGTTTQ
ncbi:MAG: hypothetical protein NZ480_06785 [Bdellovibrionaceae bacterium]|nr:hypothetical protein [Pseudobdellovibrionaceae bacterium]MDW8190204.1 hypothetical protein [Pseudobdellovibrionaceae bacterium]